MLEGTDRSPQPPSDFARTGARRYRAGRFHIHHMKIPVRGQYTGGTIGRILIVRGVLVAEPERQPGAIGPLLAGEITKLAR